MSTASIWNKALNHFGLFVRHAHSNSACAAPLAGRSGSIKSLSARRLSRSAVKQAFHRRGTHRNQSGNIRSSCSGAEQDNDDYDEDCHVHHGGQLHRSGQWREASELSRRDTRRGACADTDNTGRSVASTQESRTLDVLMSDDFIS